jgi:hypothetical protein
MLDLLLIKWVTKMKPGSNSVEDHPQLSHNRHPVDGALVGAGSLWPCLYPVFGPPFTPYPLFQWYPQSKDILMNLSMKCSYSTFNAQGSRLIIVVVQLGAVKIYVAAVEALRKNRKDKMKLSLPPKLMVF